jgi:dipeptidyl aminopeptidase/acylaminoacyl peptidase
MLDIGSALGALAGAAGIWLTVATIVATRQRQLVFGRVRASRVRPHSISHRTRPITLETLDGVRLSGWLMRPRAIGPYPAVVYFGGRGSDVAWAARDAAVMFPGMMVLAVNYRGYGKSEGKPGERQIVADARMLFDWLSEHGSVDARRIAVLGRSLGTGVAIQLAAERPVRALVLVTPYDSLLALARRRARGLPVRYLLRHRFESIKYAPMVTAPTYVLRAEADRVVPRRHTDRLVQHMQAICHDEVIPGSNHSGILGQKDTKARIASFLSTQLKLDEPSLA